MFNSSYTHSVNSEKSSVSDFRLSIKKALGFRTGDLKCGIPSLKTFRVGAILLSFLSLGITSSGISPANTVTSLAAEFKTQDDAENFIYACLDLYLSAPSEKRLLIFEEYEKNIWRPLVTKDENLAYVILLCNKGFYLSRFGNIYQAIDAYEKAGKLFHDQQLENFDIIEYCLKPLGNNYSMLGDYASAENIIRNYLFIAQQNKNYEHIAGAVINLSIVFHDTGNHRSAIDILSQLLTINEIPAAKKGLIYANLAKNLEAHNNLAAARRFALLSIDFFEYRDDTEAIVHLVNSIKILSLISLHEKDTTDALLLFKKAHATAFADKASFKTRELAKLLIEYGGLWKLKKQYDQAASVYREALQILLPAYKPQRGDTLPDPATFYAENAIKECLDGLADLYERRQQPLKAIECYERSFAVEDLLRATYNYQSAKLQQQVENRTRAGKVIRLLYQLSVRTKDQRYAARAFQVAERTKALTLKDMTENRYARRLLPQDSLLRLEGQLLFKQSSLANDIVLAQREQQPEDLLRDLINRQTQLTVEIKSVQKSIAQKYPALASTNHSNWLEVKSIQQQLTTDDAVLVEYFSGDDAFYQFTLSDDSLNFFRIEDAEKVNRLCAELSRLFSDATSIHNETDQYKASAFSLYQLLHVNNTGARKKIILIPDGMLHTIPFDALLYEEATGLRYSDFPFLVKKWVIAYQPSAYLYAHFHTHGESLNKQHLLGMFPVFENTSQSLEYSLEEAADIQKHFSSGNYLLRDQATKQAFLDNVTKYSIVHLSTHAQPGDEVTPPSIYFRDSILYLPQIYGLQLQADLMVLSACQTGVGRLAKGEGVLSLAHGFNFAGVRNLILSLWKVNDRSTAVLLSGFYEHYLHTGLKAESLQQAKLDYLYSDNIQNANKSPYYWAAFAYYGDFEPAQKRSLSFALIILLMSIALLAIVYFIRKRKIKLNVKQKKFS